MCDINVVGLFYLEIICKYNIQYQNYECNLHQFAIIVIILLYVLIYVGTLPRVRWLGS